jgi:uncharacterized protein (DUF2384 family)
MTRFAGRHLAQDRLVLSSVSNATEDYIMIDSQRIAEVMGGAEAIGERARSLSALESFVHAGLPEAALKQVVDPALSDRKERRQFLYAIVPEAIYKRRRLLIRSSASARNVWRGS